MNILLPFLAGNKQIRARITKPSDNFRGMLPARSLAHIPIRYNIKAGTLLSDQQKRNQWLLAEHHGYPGYDVFLAMHVNCEITHSRWYSGIHPVTKLETGEFKEREDLLCGVLELGEPQFDKGILVPKDVYYFGSEIGLKDKINGRPVTKVLKLSGIYRVEVS